MKRKSSNRVPRGFFDRVGMAAIFGVDVGQFDRRYRPLIGQQSVVVVRRKMYFPAREIINALITEALQKQSIELSSVDGDPLLTGSTTPGLERYRAARAEQEELNLAERKEEMVRLSVIKPMLTMLLSGLKATLDKLVIKFGNDAAEILNEAIDEACDRIEKTLKEGGFLKGDPSAGVNQQ